MVFRKKSVINCYFFLLLHSTTAQNTAYSAFFFSTTNKKRFYHSSKFQRSSQNFFFILFSIFTLLSALRKSRSFLSYCRRAWHGFVARIFFSFFIFYYKHKLLILIIRRWRRGENKKKRLWKSIYPDQDSCFPFSFHLQDIILHYYGILSKFYTHKKKDQDKNRSNY